MEDLRSLLEEFDAMMPYCETCGEPIIMFDEGNAFHSWKHDNEDGVCKTLDPMCDDQDRYESLLTLFEEFGGIDDARSQADNEPTLIAEHEFEDYARQLAEDIAPSSDVQEAMESWPFNCIDWERAARELSMDYTTVEWDGTTYYYRSF